ncbi:exonuclease domain-containing protein [Ascidiimonas aurantiaca]|uniref:exonuclease domain-containing protein n=1 Tax=Ascidiimonas aurantiaca TaxID=1685432 RepID=UPI0030ED28E1
MYAILDIETTGGKYNEEGITEIAIYRFDGHEVTDRFISLVNPEREIQEYVANLTGITNAMLRNAPRFYEVAKRIVEITQGCILIAHNAKFDYRILRTEFRRLGFEYDRKTLCTIELAKRLIPGKDSYSLGKLSRSLGIPVSDRHRAHGDALATLKLFKMLLAKDTEKSIVKTLLRSTEENTLPSRLLDILDQLPATTGVFYIHDKEGQIIYLSRSNNIRRKVNKLFTSSHDQAIHIQEHVKAVTYEQTGSELISIIKEYIEIQQNRPVVNGSARFGRYKYALYEKTDDDGYCHLMVGKFHSNGQASATFKSYSEAKSTLFKMSDNFNLCSRFVSLSIKKNCTREKIYPCGGACIGNEPPEDYNLRVSDSIKAYTYPYENMLIVGKGREIDERSVILIEKGIFKGIGFYQLNHQINHLKILREIITTMPNDKYLEHIIQSYLRKKESHKIININHLLQ